MTNVTESVIGYKQKVWKQNWMMDEILPLFDEQRQYKNQKD